MTSRAPLSGLRLFLLWTLLLSLSVLVVSSVSFTSNPDINDGAATYTVTDLVCAWTMSGDTTAINVTWYLNGSYFSSTYDGTGSITSSTIGSGNTAKGETWLCNVTLFNATANISQTDSLLILNSPPSTEAAGAGVFDGGVDVGFTINIDEDETINLDVNATDADSDTLRYQPADYFCTRDNSAPDLVGLYTCAPTHADILNGSGPGEMVTQVEIPFAASDGELIAGRDILFIVTPVNDVPVPSFSAQSVLVTATMNETFSVSDEEQDYPIDASLDASTSAAILDDLTVSVEGNSTIRVVYATSPPEYSDVGNHTVVINVTDARNASVLATFTLEIISVNFAPYFVSFSPWNHSSTVNGTYIVAQGENIIIDIAANDPDTNGSNQTITFSDDTGLFVTATINSTATNVTDALGRINFTPTNADVGSELVTITITNDGLTNETVLNFTVTNVNDAPVIYNVSYDAGNTAGNQNITPLIGYLGVPFVYQINYSDPDEDIGLDSVNWSDNTSSFNVTDTGLISFTPSGLPRNETINLTVTDESGLTDTRIITFEIRDNTAPYYNDTFPVLLCSEGVPCLFNVSYYAKEDDAGDSIDEYARAFIGDSLGSFDLNSSTGLISFTPDQDEIGNYTINLTIEDTRGAIVGQLLNVTINNTDDAPIWDSYDFSGETIIENHEFYFQLLASDFDLVAPGVTENLTFMTNLSWVDVAYQSTTNETVYALLNINPNSSHVGSWSVRLNVTDASGLINSTSVSFTILAQTNSPEVDDISPYGNDSASDALVDSWLDVSAFTTLEENVSFNENTTNVLFAVNASDDDQAGPPYGWLTYTWYYDGSVVQASSSTSNYNRSFDFQSSGSHTLSVMINDSTLESSTWTWNLDIQDVNRPPTLPKNFTGTKNNLSISQNILFSDYFVYTPSAGGFYDPDDDLNGNGNITGNETLNLTYSITTCQYATLEAEENSLSIVPVAVGTCFVIFNATDPGGSSVESNIIQITVTEVPQGAESVVVSSGGGGGGSSTTSTFIPLETEVESPHPLSLLTPKLVTIYEDASIVVPIELDNNWTAPLEGITIGSESNASGVTVSFDTDYLEELPVNGSAQVMMTVSGYRIGENFEVKVNANVTDPDFQDSAIILFNSIEQSQEGRDVNVKVTFAKDLLSEHDECQELNELLVRADTELKTGNIRTATDMVDTVINGCKYLLSQTQQETQRPSVIRTPMLELDERTATIIGYTSLAVFLILASLSMLYYHQKTKEEYDF